jgi:hypothetical protein
MYTVHYNQDTVVMLELVAKHAANTCVKLLNACRRSVHARFRAILDYLMQSYNIYPSYMYSITKFVLPPS